MRCCHFVILSFSLAFILLGQGQHFPKRDIRKPRLLPAGSPGTLSVKAMAAGGSHSVVLASDGTVWTWGSNSEGQLGNGPFAAPPVAAEVYSLSGVVAISAGFAHTLALKADGTVWAWGKNREGQLGDGTTINRPTPVEARGLGGVVAVAAGNSHGLAIRNDGTVWAWGSNAFGELGDETTIGRATAAPVRGLVDITAIAAGQAHSLALRRDGTVWAWGNNWYGQLGNGTLAPQTWPAPAPSLPSQIGGLTGVTAIAAGYQHSMALKADGTVWVWGNDGAFAILRPTPTEAAGLTNVRAIAAGLGTSLVVKEGGTLWEWGYDILSHPSSRTPAVQSMPTQVPQLAGVEKVALPVGSTHGLALQRDGTVWEWGGFQGVQLGRATLARPVPSRVGGLSDVVAISGGLALKRDGTVWTWDPPFTNGWLDLPTPHPVAGLDGVGAIASGTTGYNLALKSDGTVWNVLGPSAVSRVPDLTDVVAVAAGDSRGLAVKRDGTGWEWAGVNSTPAQISDVSDIVAVAEAYEWWFGFGEDEIVVRTIALKRDGTVWAWDGAWWSKRSAPAQVGGLAGIKAIAGGAISLALTEDGTVYQWDATVDRPAPVQVGGISGVKMIAIGDARPVQLSSEAHALALKADSTVWAWGPNEFGELGDGTTAHRATPVQVAGLSDVVATGAAGFSSVAVKRDGTVWGWGAGPNPIGSAWSPPVQVPALGAPDLAVSLSHSGDFTVAEVAVYKASVASIGRIPTSGLITLTDVLPPGLTFVSAIGEGWICTGAERIVTCTNPGPISPGVSNVINLTVRVEPQAYPGVTNLVTVSTESDVTAWNNSMGDPTVVLSAQH